MRLNLFFDLPETLGDQRLKCHYFRVGRETPSATRVVRGPRVVFDNLAISVTDPARQNPSFGISLVQGRNTLLARSGPVFVTGEDISGQNVTKRFVLRPHFSEVATATLETTIQTAPPGSAVAASFPWTRVVIGGRPGFTRIGGVTLSSNELRMVGIYSPGNRRPRRIGVVADPTDADVTYRYRIVRNGSPHTTRPFELSLQEYKLKTRAAALLAGSLVGLSTLQIHRAARKALESFWGGRPRASLNRAIETHFATGLTVNSFLVENGTFSLSGFRLVTP